MFDPKEDGITHINIYSKGNTNLGRLLSNFAFTPFTHPAHGKFNSIEGYWFWLQAEPSFYRETLRILSGPQAKSVGSKLINKYLQDTDWFQSLMKEAISAKCYDNYKIYKELKASTLPFTHYYVYGNKKVDAGFKWLIDMWEERRNILHDEET